MDQVFSFFKEPKNLEQITPAYLNFKVVKQSTNVISEGTKINYRLSLHGFPMWWQSKIVDWEPNHKFSDTKTHGPYNHWYHTHEFEEKDGGTLIKDHVLYKLPFGIPGDCVAGREQECTSKLHQESHERCSRSNSNPSTELSIQVRIW